MSAFRRTAVRLKPDTTGNVILISVNVRDPTVYAIWLWLFTVLLVFRVLGQVIVAARAPNAPKRLTQELVAFVQKLRNQDLFKSPGVAETLDWASALVELDAVALDPALVSDTLGVLLKYQDDIANIEGAKAKQLVDEVQSELRAHAVAAGA